MAKQNEKTPDKRPADQPKDSPKTGDGHRRIIPLTEGTGSGNRPPKEKN